MLKINTLKKSERLHHKKLIDLLFKKGKTVNFHPVKLFWLVVDNKPDNPPVRVLFAVPGKTYKKAVSRNLLKRRMREAYRTNKHDLTEKARQKNLQLIFAILFTGRQITSYTEIETAISKGLDHISVRIGNFK